MSKIRNRRKKLIAKILASANCISKNAIRQPKACSIVLSYTEVNNIAAFMKVSFDEALQMAERYFNGNATEDENKRFNEYGKRKLNES